MSALLLALALAVPLTLDEALALAERRNPELAAARASQQAHEADRDAASRATWPRLTATADLSRTDNPARVFAEKLGRGDFAAPDFEVARLNHPDALSHLATGVALEVPVDVSGRLRAHRQAASEVARGAGAEEAEARAEVRLQVIRAYRQAALASNAVAVTTRAVAAARGALEVLEARAEEGVALQADVLRARARRRQREADLALREEERRVSHAALVRLLGAPPDAEFEPVETAGAPAAMDEPLEAWVARAADRRGAVAVARARSEAARWAADAEARTARPDLALYGQVLDDRWTDGGQVSTTVGATVRWSPFDATRDRRLAAARARELAARHMVQAAQDQVHLEVVSAFWRARTARERYEAARGGAAEGQEALRIVRERRLAGLATLTDELETEAASLAAELQEIGAAADVALADAALRRAAGDL